MRAPTESHLEGQENRAHKLEMTGKSKRGFGKGGGGGGGW